MLKNPGQYSPSHLGLLSIILFILLSIVQAGKPLHLDNMDFPAVARATASSGLPVYYRGEENPQHSGLYHPPLYIYTLALWYKLFGFSITTTRMFGVLFTILQGVIALRIFRCIFGNALASRIEPFFWLLFLLNPYTLAISSIADIDSTIYGPILLLIIYSVLSCVWEDGALITKPPSTGRILVSGILFGVGLWAKLTTILILIPFMFFLLALPGHFLKAAKTTAMIVLTGTGLFVLTYMLYGYLLNLNVKYTYDFLIINVLNKGSSGAQGMLGRLNDGINNVEVNLPFTLRWTGTIVWLLILSSLGSFAYVAFKRRSLKLYHLLIISILPVVNIFYYLIKTLSFGASPAKYHFVFWSLFYIPLAILAARVSLNDLLGDETTKRGINRWEQWFLAAGFILATIFGLTYLKDHVLLHPTQLHFSPILVPLVLTLVLASLYAAASRFQVKRTIRVLIALLVMCDAGVLAGVAWAQVKRPYTTTYNYGQLGITEAVAYIRFHSAPTDTISSMKDVGFMSERKYFENYAALFNDAAAERLVKNLETGKIRYAVFTRGIGEDQIDAYPNLKVGIERTCELVARFGNYVIYEPKYWISKTEQKSIQPAR